VQSNKTIKLYYSKPSVAYTLNILPFFEFEVSDKHLEAVNKAIPWDTFKTMLDAKITDSTGTVTSADTAQLSSDYSNTVDFTTLGTYTAAVSVVFPDNTTGTATTQVKIVDKIAPVITVLNKRLYFEIGGYQPQSAGERAGQL